MKKFFQKFGIGIILIVVILGALYFCNCERNTRLLENYSSLAKNDTLRILLADSRSSFFLKIKNQEKMDSIKGAYQDSTVSKGEMIRLLKETYKSNQTLIAKRNKLKNKEVFSFKVGYYSLKDKQINICVILAIILISGILGGFVRTKSSLLVDFLKDLEEIKGVKALLNSDQNINTDKLKLAINSLVKRTEGLKDGDIENADHEKVLVNIIFGILASSLSFLALTTFNSKVLDFQSDVDYFIFMSWCTLGALFAKNWTKSLYDRVTGSSSKPKPQAK